MPGRRTPTDLHPHRPGGVSLLAKKGTKGVVFTGMSTIIGFISSASSLQHLRPCIRCRASHGTKTEGPGPAGGAASNTMIDERTAPHRSTNSRRLVGALVGCGLLIGLVPLAHHPGANHVDWDAWWAEFFCGGEACPETATEVIPGTKEKFFGLFALLESREESAPPHSRSPRPPNRRPWQHLHVHVRHLRHPSAGLDGPGV